MLTRSCGTAKSHFELLCIAMPEKFMRKVIIPTTNIMLDVEGEYSRGMLHLCLELK